MSCNFPVGVYRKDGSQAFRPCGSCLMCRLSYAASWALRCVHEAQMFDENCFVTLTYDNEHLPDDGSVKKGDLQKFLKRLRRKIEPRKVRFFACGEYGEKLSRPHYHLCLFGFNFDDRELFKASRWKRSKFGSSVDMLYISEMLGKVWKEGFHSIGEFSYKSAGYVARYVTKKINGKMAPAHYGEKESEFALMSRRPGIGAEWLKKYKSDIYPKDYFVMNGKKFASPRYYDSILEKLDNEMLNQVKERRIEKAEMLNSAREGDIRKMQKEKYRQSVTKRLERDFENGKN